VSAMNF